MRWLVTGGCGFIGRNFIRLLLARSNDTIRVVDDLSVGTRAELEAISPVVALDPETLKPVEAGGAACRIEIVAGDVRDAVLARRVVAGADAGIHLAANTGAGPPRPHPRRAPRSFPPIRCRPTAPASSLARPIARPISAASASIRSRFASVIATGRC